MPMGKNLRLKRPLSWLRTLFSSKEARLLQSLRESFPNPTRRPQPAALIEKGEDLFWTLR